MRKLTNTIPDIFDVQLDPRLQGEPFYFAMRQTTRCSEALIVRVGPFKVFGEYLTK